MGELTGRPPHRPPPIGIIDPALQKPYKGFGSGFLLGEMNSRVGLGIVGFAGAVRGADYVLVAIPSKGFRGLLADLKPLIGRLFTLRLGAGGRCRLGNYQPESL